MYEALSHKFNQTQTVKSRFWGIQANTSQLSYKELDGANHLHTSSAADLSEAILKLKSDCHLKIFGGVVEQTAVTWKKSLKYRK